MRIDSTSRRRSMPAARVERSGPAAAASAVDLVTAKAARALGMKKTRSPADGSAGPSRRPSQASRSAAGRPVRAGISCRGSAPVEVRLSTNSRRQHRRGSTLRNASSRSVSGDSPQVAERFTPQHGLLVRRQCQQSLALVDRVISQSRDRLGTKRQRSVSVRGQLAQDRNRPGDGLWLSVRTASIATRLITARRKPRKRSSVRAGWSGRSIRKPRSNTGAEVRGSFKRATM